MRTGFPDFEDREACDDDRYSLRTENADLAHILKPSVDIIYVDNPPLKGRNAETNKEIREVSRKRLLTYLGKCRKTYRPSNIDTLNERVQDYKTHEEKLNEKMKELERARKQQEEEFRKKLENLKEEQAQELRENRRQFEEKLDKVQKENEKKLEETKKKLEEDAQKKLDDVERRAKERERDAEARHKEEIRNINEANEQRVKNISEDLRKNREEMDRLRREASERGSNNSDIIAQLEALKVNDNKLKEEELKLKK